MESSHLIGRTRGKEGRKGEIWRRARDSNPQGLAPAGFQDQCNSRSASSPNMLDDTVRFQPVVTVNTLEKQFPLQGLSFCHIALYVVKNQRTATFRRPYFPRVVCLDAGFELFCASIVESPVLETLQYINVNHVSPKSQARWFFPLRRSPFGEGTPLGQDQCNSRSVRPAFSGTRSVMPWESYPKNAGFSRLDLIGFFA